MARIARIVAMGSRTISLKIGNDRKKIFDYIEQEAKGWKEFIEAPDNPDEIKGIREKTRTGRPLGTNDFIERLKGQLKRVFKLKPKGRPKKKVDK